MNATTPHHNRDLARSLVADLLEFQPDDAPSIWNLWDGSDETESILHADETTEEIAEWLQEVLLLASNPVLLPSTGIDKENRRHLQQCVQERIRLIAIECIALLETTTTK